MNGTYKENRMNSQRPAARRQTVNMRNVYVASFFAAAALLLVLSMFLFFNVSEIKIEGVTLYEQDQILGVGGVSTGQNLVRTNTDIVEKRLKDTLVYLDDVKVTKKFPSTLVITCTEAEKAADIEYKNSYYVLSASGKILKELLNDLHDLKFKNIDSIDLTTRSDIKLMYDGRLEIKLGSSVDMEYKLTYLKAVIDKSITDDYEGTLIYNGADSGISAIPKSQDESSKPDDTSSAKPDDSSSAVSADTNIDDGSTWDGDNSWSGDDSQGYGDDTNAWDGNDDADNAGTDQWTNENGNTDWEYDNGGDQGYTDNGYADNGYVDDQTNTDW